MGLYAPIGLAVKREVRDLVPTYAQAILTHLTEGRAPGSHPAPKAVQPPLLVRRARASAHESTWAAQRPPYLWQSAF